MSSIQNRFVTSRSTTTGNLFVAHQFMPEAKLRWSRSCRGQIINCFGDRGRCLTSLYKKGIIAIDMISGAVLWDTVDQPLHYESSRCVLTNKGYLFCLDYPKDRMIRTVAFNA